MLSTTLVYASDQGGAVQYWTIAQINNSPLLERESAAVSKKARRVIGGTELEIFHDNRPAEVEKQERLCG